MVICSTPQKEHKRLYRIDHLGKLYQSIIFYASIVVIWSGRTGGPAAGCPKPRLFTGGWFTWLYPTGGRYNWTRYHLQTEGQICNPVNEMNLPQLHPSPAARNVPGSVGSVSSRVSTVPAAKWEKTRHLHVGSCKGMDNKEGSWEHWCNNVYSARLWNNRELWGFK